MWIVDMRFNGSAISESAFFVGLTSPTPGGSLQGAAEFRHYLWLDLTYFISP
jgi:hypothetical protein